MYIKELFLLKLFTFFVCFSTFFTYILNSNFINYFLIFPILILILIFNGFLKSGTSLTKMEFIILFFSLGDMVLSLFYYFNDPFYGGSVSAQLMTIILIPFFIYFNIRFSKGSIASDYISFLYNILIFFLLFQLLICIGQISTYTFGVGFPVPEAQSDKYMVSGSFVNSNNLAVIIIFISYFVSQVEGKYSTKSNNLMWLMIFFILFITVSRSALLIVFFIFISTRKMNKKTLINFLIGVAVLIPVVINIYSWMGGFEFFNRIIERLESLSTMLESGIMSDDSMSVRLKSYLYFIGEIPGLGLGSGEMYNYYNYSGKASFETNLIFANPHSYIVEIGYWMGFTGLILFVLLFSSLFYYGNRSLFYFFIVMISMSIPSSLLDFYLFFYFLILCFFVKKYMNQNLVLSSKLSN